MKYLYATLALTVAVALCAPLPAWADPTSDHVKGIFDWAKQSYIKKTRGWDFALTITDVSRVVHYVEGRLTLNGDVLKGTGTHYQDNARYKLPAMGGVNLNSYPFDAQQTDSVDIAIDQKGQVTLTWTGGKSQTFTLHAEKGVGGNLDHPVFFGTCTRPAYLYKPDSIHCPYTLSLEEFQQDNPNG
jgi:hypothetical protein